MYFSVIVSEGGFGLVRWNGNLAPEQQRILEDSVNVHGRASWIELTALSRLLELTRLMPV